MQQERWQVACSVWLTRNRPFTKFCILFDFVYRVRWYLKVFVKLRYRRWNCRKSSKCPYPIYVNLIACHVISDNTSVGIDLKELGGGSTAEMFEILPREVKTFSNLLLLWQLEDMRINYTSLDSLVLFVTISSLSVLLMSGIICH